MPSWAAWHAMQHMIRCEAPCATQCRHRECGRWSSPAVDSKQGTIHVQPDAAAVRAVIDVEQASSICHAMRVSRDAAAARAAIDLERGTIHMPRDVAVRAAIAERMLPLCGQPSSDAWHRALCSAWHRLPY